ncbi:hypothetical protein P6O75_14935, partial [Clostridium perfringens]|nr:hypothetical protein [Clostridium perfringens]
ALEFQHPDPAHLLPRRQFGHRRIADLRHSRTDTFDRHERKACIDLAKSGGVRWGAPPERTDTRSGNPNFTVPLPRAMGRGCWSVPLALNYNA